jgi:large conductance mechanosensitive channel
MIKEFKTFISRGNVLDLAVGIIIGGAFGKIVSSLVSDIIMPLVGIIMGGLDFTSLTLTVNDSVIMYGTFIQNIIDFLIIGFSVFMMIKFINRFKKKEEKKNEEKPIKSNEEKLLEEIRDLLKKKK